MSWLQKRWILHVDLNSFYANVECLYRTNIRHLPVIVAGDPDARQGIVLTKNQIAKQHGIQTGETIGEAKNKCPGLMVVPADHPLYGRFSNEFHGMLFEYSDRVEAFGLDESWLDITQPGMTWKQAKKIADEIRYRTWTELGLTASVGVSYNKPFAKLGSDMRKPNATTVITPMTYREMVWPLIANELLYVGPETMKKLYRRCIYTIGDLANTPEDTIKHMLGKNGLMIRRFARGEDTSPVMPYGAEGPLRSISNSTTTAVDMENESDVRSVFTILMESVAARMLELGLRARCVHIFVRQSQGLAVYACQRTLRYPTSLTREILDVAMALYREKRYGNLLPFRSIGICCSSLSSRYAPTQTDLFGDEESRLKEEALDETVYWLKQRYGQKVIQLGAATNERFARINPKEDEKYHAPAAAYYRG